MTETNDITKQNHKPELLLPAGSLEVLKIAVLYGADAVYLGGEAYSLRAKALNFTEEEMAEGIRFAHSHGAKVYVTANIYAHNGDIDGIAAYFTRIGQMEEKPDALLVADLGVFAVARRILPDMELHVSTQANTTNYESAAVWRSLGAKRIVCARELSLREIAQLKEKMPEGMELEAFVHGAMCISYSGRCLLSNYFTGRDANKGACTHPCRWEYALMEENRPGEYLPIGEDGHGTYIMNSKDLCMVAHIPELVAAGIDSFKVEGRMKTALYVACAARTYRQAIDDYFADEALYESRIPYYSEQIADCTLRGFTTGFYFGRPDETAYVYGNSDYIRNYTYLGFVEEMRTDADGTFYRITQKNKFSVGETIEIMTPKGDNIKTDVLRMTDGEGNAIASCPHSKQVFWVELSHQAGVFDILRRQEIREKTGI